MPSSTAVTQHRGPARALRNRLASALRRLGGRPEAPPPAPPDWIEEDVGRRLLGLDGGLGLFRWVHLLDAFARAGKPPRVLSFGSGEGLHETLLARLFPQCEVCGIDLRQANVEVELPNLRFLEGDLLDGDFTDQLEPADLVFSIECLEHIEDDRSIFVKMAQLLRPGGLLYLEVPFANEAERSDPELCRRELTAHGHVRPGYGPRQLAYLASEGGLSVVHIAGAFWFPIQPMLWLAQQHFDSEALASHWRTLLAVAELDLRETIPESRSEATAIKLLASRR